MGVAGGAAVSTAGYMGAVVTCLAGAVLCPVVAVGGILGGGKLGSRLGNGKNVFFTVMGKKGDGSNYIQSFRFLNKRTAKKRPRATRLHEGFSAASDVVGRRRAY